MDKDIKAVFGKVWPVHVANLTRHVIACRKAFDGDLDMFLVMAVIGERTLSERNADPTMDYDGFRSGRGALSRPLEINLRSIAEFSGIPRETVRRKLVALEKKGWISRSEDGTLHATRQAARDLEPLTEAGIQYVAAMMRLIGEVLPARPPG